MRIQRLPAEDPAEDAPDQPETPDERTWGFWFILGVAFVAIGSSIGGGSLSNRSFVFYAVGVAFIFLAWKGRVRRDARRGPVRESLPDEEDPGDDDGEDDEWEDDRDEQWRTP